MGNKNVDAARARLLSTNCALTWCARAMKLSVFMGGAMPTMPYSVDDDISNQCYLHAEECGRRAASQDDLRLRQDFLELERRWTALARTSMNVNAPRGDVRDSG